MRVILADEKMKRGCMYCKHVDIIHNGRKSRIGCPFDECPYTVLDKYETYEEFMATEDCRILVDEFFQTVADCYALATPVKMSKGHSFDRN